MNEEKISVIIPTYERKNKELSIELLDRALESVQKQTYKKIEIIIVIDNNSDVLSEFLIEKQKIIPMLLFFNFGTKVGAATTRNFGISKATGKWIALLDDDDVWIEDKLEKQINVAKLYPYNIILASLFHNNRVIPNKIYSDEIPISEYLMARAFGKHIGTVQTSTIFCNKVIFREIPFSEGLQKHQDWDWIIRVSQKYDITYMREPLSIYTTDTSERMSSNKPWQTSLSWLKSIEYLLTEKAKSAFILEIIIPGVIEDFTLSVKEKNRIIKDLCKEIRIINKLSVNNLYLSFKNIILYYKYKKKS